MFLVNSICSVGDHARPDLVRSAQRYLISYQSTDLNYAVKISSDRQRTMRARRQTDCDEIMHDYYSSLCASTASIRHLFVVLQN